MTKSIAFCGDSKGLMASGSIVVVDEKHGTLQRSHKSTARGLAEQAEQVSGQDPPWRPENGEHCIYPLVNVYIAMENHHF